VDSPPPALDICSLPANVSSASLVLDRSHLAGGTERYAKMLIFAAGVIAKVPRIGGLAPHIVAVIPAIKMVSMPINS
jgi:hypothetical protein